jgi:hypothetical protein
MDLYVLLYASMGMQLVDIYPVSVLCILYGHLDISVEFAFRVHRKT